MIDNSIFLFRNQSGRKGGGTIKSTSSQISCRVGCTNPTATNFDSTADYDDGSCSFDGSGGVMPPSDNYNYGCTDVTASN